MTGTSLFWGIGDEVILGFCGLLTIIYFIYQCLPNQVSNQDNQISNEDLNVGRIRTNSDDCSICLSETTYAIQTNCGHIYCAQCIISYYENVTSSSVATALSKSLRSKINSRILKCLFSDPFDTPTCPYCRQRMTMLLFYFSETERNLSDDNPIEMERRNALVNTVRNYNSRYSGEPRSLSEHLRDLPVLLRHLWTFFWSPDGLSWLFRLRILTLGGMAGLYLLSPFDIVPEAAFGIIGILDDLVIVALFLLYASMLYRNFITASEN